ncbi:MAG: ATP-binding cassette domain-containing protein [Atopobiaceae bacterium]|nr:ATP-binding cassette domain-containing protein [Atopobiaceae bacterium]
MREILRVRHLCKNDILRDITFAVEEGEMVAVMGPSGSGKSTLLYQVSGMDQADAGEVWHLYHQGNRWRVHVRVRGATVLRERAGCHSLYRHGQTVCPGKELLKIWSTGHALPNTIYRLRHTQREERLLGRGGP